MQGRNCFTESEINHIRALLREKSSASRSAQKGIRNQIRDIGFYITDFDTSSKGFTVAAFDGLIRRGQIKIKDSAQSQGMPSPTRESAPQDQETESIRASYRPDNVVVLFVGESPPAGGTFFYYANSNLFRCIRQGFFDAYEDERIQEDFLAFFKEMGCYLDDLCLEPVNDKSDADRELLRSEGIQPLADRIQRMHPEVVICVMKGISAAVRMAVCASGVPGIRFEETPFPGFSEDNRRNCIWEIRRIVDALLDEGILAE